MKKLLALVLFLLSLPCWGDLNVTLTPTSSATDPPGTFYTVSVPDVTQMKANAPAGQHVYVFVGILHKLNGAGLIPVDMLSLNATSSFTNGAVTGNGVTVTNFTVDPLNLSNPPVNVNTPGSTTGMSIATDQTTFTATNLTSVLGGMQPGDSIWVVAGTGTTPATALISGIQNGTSKDVYQKPMMSVAPASLAADHTVGTTPCPEAMGSISVTSLLAAGQGLDVSITSSNKVFRMNGPSLSNAISGSFSMAAGAAASTIAVSYDCSALPSQTGTITLVGSTAGVNGSQTVTVSVTVTAK